MIVACIVTILTESALIALLVKKSPAHIIILVTGVELVTHPISMYFYVYEGISLLIVEGMVVLIEACIYNAFWYAKSVKSIAFWFLVSFVANLTSLVVTILVL